MFVCLYYSLKVLIVTLLFCFVFRFNREGSFDLGNPSDSFTELHTSTQNPNKGNDPDKDHSVSNGSEADCAPEDYLCPISKVRDSKPPLHLEILCNGLAHHKLILV